MWLDFGEGGWWGGASVLACISYLPEWQVPALDPALGAQSQQFIDPTTGQIYTQSADGQLQASSSAAGAGAGAGGVAMNGMGGMGQMGMGQMGGMGAAMGGMTSGGMTSGNGPTREQFQMLQEQQTQTAQRQMQLELLVNQLQSQLQQTQGLVAQQVLQSRSGPDNIVARWFGSATVVPLCHRA